MHKTMLICILLMVVCLVFMSLGINIGRYSMPATQDWYAWVDRYACVHVDMGAGIEWHYQMDCDQADWLLEVLYNERTGRSFVQ